MIWIKEALTKQKHINSNIIRERTIIKKYKRERLVIALLLMSIWSAGNVCRAQDDIYIDQKVEIIELEKGFSLTFKAQNFGNNSFDFIGSDIANKGLNCQFKSDMGINPYVFLLKSKENDNNKFLLLEYGKNYCYHIKKIIINWTKIKDHEGGLTIYGSNNPYTSTQSLDDIRKTTEIDTVKPDYTSGKSEIEIQGPYQYIAIVHYNDGKSNVYSLEMAAFSSFTIEFEEIEKAERDVRIGDGNPINVEWKKEGIELQDYVWINNEVIDPQFMEFYIKPDFEMDEKPDITGNQPEGWFDHDWRLLKLFEKHSINYDGYLESDKPIKCNFDENQNILSIPAPCSGRYTLNVEYSDPDNPDFNFEAPMPVSLNIYPSINNIYKELREEDDGKDELSALFAFCINFINLSEKASRILFYPYDSEMTDEPYAPKTHQGIIHVPGFYNGKIYYKWDESYSPKQLAQPTVNHVGMKVNENVPEGYIDSSENPIDMSGVNQTGTSLHIKLAKNGVVTPDGDEATILVQLSRDANSEEADGVETIRLDTDINTHIEYFNMSGIRVNSRNLSRGIYIKRSGKTVEKVIF